MSCRYCLRENSERLHKNYTTGVNHDGSLEYVTGKDLYNLFKLLLERGATKGSAEEAPHNGLMFLVPYESTDGRIDWVDRYTNRVIAVTGVRNDKPYYFGPLHFMQRLFGRGEFSEYIKLAEDGDIFHDRKKQRYSASLN